MRPGAVFPASTTEPSYSLQPSPTMSHQVLGITRSISACKRCRQKKIKCSHDFPRCSACAKANVECVSLDPATGREVPRSYIVHLENRISELENYIKTTENISPSTNTNNNDSNIPTTNSDQNITQNSSASTPTPNMNIQSVATTADSKTPVFRSPIIPTNNNTINNGNISNSTGKNISVISDSGNLSNITHTNDAQLLDSIQSYNNNPKGTPDDSSRPTSFSGNGISFSKLMFAAVHFNDNSNDKREKLKERRRSSAASSSIPATSIKPPIDPTASSMSSFSKNIALLPPKQQALDFLTLYFDQSNSQLPIFHREEFLRNYFIPIYGDIPEDYSNLLKDNDQNLKNQLPKIDEHNTWYYQYTRLLDAETGVDPEMDPFKFSARVSVPKRFRKSLYFINIVFAVASSVWHLQYPSEISENFKNAALIHIEDAYSSINRLEALQAMLCLTLYSLMRPCVPGVWYLSGSSLRLCIDLGLHNESSLPSTDPFLLDMRRRLFWCCYSLDRQICVYLGRPFGIPEESIKVPFPSILDDSNINGDSTFNSLNPKNPSEIFSYKHISLAMFKIRQLQAEIQSILYDKREIPRIFPNLSTWFTDIIFRLDNWKASLPKITEKMNCEFTVEFFDLNYYHAKMLLHGLSPARYILNLNDFINLTEASKETLTTFYKLWKRGALNYTWAVTQNVFMAHMNFLYAIFNSDEVKNKTTAKEVMKLAGYSNSILKSLINRCNAAEQCLEVLMILSQALLKLKYSGDDFYKDWKNNNNHGKNSNKDNNSTGRMDRIPSEDEVKTLQPGGHMTGSMRRLIVSIPELMNAEEGKSSKQDYNNHNDDDDDDDNELSGDRKRIKVDNTTGTPFATTVSSPYANSNTNTPPVGSLDLTKDKKGSETNDSIFEGSFTFNDIDMARFFDEVRKVDSPDSGTGRSYSHFSSSSVIDDAIAPEIISKPVNSITMNMNVTRSPSSSMSASGGSSSSPAVSINSNRSEGNFSSFGLSALPQSMRMRVGLNNSHFQTNSHTQSQQQQSSQQYNNQQYSTTLSQPYQVSSPPFQPQQYPTYQTQFQYLSNSNMYPTQFAYSSAPTYPQQQYPTFSPPSSMPASIPPILPSGYSTGEVPTLDKLDNKTLDSNNVTNTPNSSTSRKHSREGKRIYKLMLETGTESIWDQFFAHPFKLDEM